MDIFEKDEQTFLLLSSANLIPNLFDNYKLPNIKRILKKIDFKVFFSA